MLITTRARLVRVRHEVMNQIKAVLMAYGLPLPNARGRRFDQAILAVVQDREWLGSILLPLVEVWRSTRVQTDRVDKALLALARERTDCRRLMTVPGIGAITALTFAAAIDDPARFARSSSVGAYLGLTPRRYQSGEVDHRGRISRCGDAQLRMYLYEAALVLLFRVRKWCALKSWGLRLVKRSGVRKAAVALARRLAVTMHAMLVSQTDFQWSSAPASHG